MAVDDSYTKSLLHFDGSDLSTTFTDESGKTWTPYDNARLSTTSPKFGTASGYFDGGTDRITVPASSDFDFGTGEFTVDFWIKSSDTTRQDVITQDNTSADSNWWGLLFNVSSSGRMYLYENSTARITATSTGWNDGSWNHVALVRTSNTMMLFLNGTQVGSSYTTSYTYGNSSVGLCVANSTGGSANGVTGNMDELRISKGVARWTSGFTPPIAAYAPGGSADTGYFMGII